MEPEMVEPAQLPAPRPVSPSPAGVFLARLSPGSRRATAQRLRTIVEMTGGRDIASYPWERLDYAHAQLIRTGLVEKDLAPNTCNAILAALRGVAQEAWRLGLMDAEQCQRVRDVKAVRGTRSQKGRALATSEISRLLEACSDPDDPAAVRDAALLAILFSAGLRRAEAVGLDVADYDRAEGSITVRGKGNKERTQYLADWAQERLDAWLAYRTKNIPKTTTEPAVFVGTHRSGSLIARRLTDQAVRQILKRRSAEAGIADCSPHDLRRTFVSELLDAGVDLSTVQRMAGHSQPTTTARYDRRGDRARRAAVQRLRI